MLYLFAPMSSDSKAFEFEKKFKILDKSMILKAIERQNEDNKN